MSPGNHFHLGVGPVNALFEEVEGETIGPLDGIAGDNNFAVRSVHAGPLNARLIAPVRPEDHSKQQSTDE